MKSLQIKDFKEEDIFKKCGFKKAEDFIKQVEWNVKLCGINYIINVYAKTVGRANSENKYDFPPPIDKILFYGSCAIVAKKINEGKLIFINLTVEIWEKIYEKLFGGFESLVDTAISDEQEEDELDKVPKEKKTKQGYLKDGFVIDSDGEDESEYETDDNSDSNKSTEEDSDIQDNGKDEPDIILQDIGSELSDESYDYE